MKSCRKKKEVQTMEIVVFFSIWMSKHFIVEENHPQLVPANASRTGMNEPINTETLNKLDLHGRWPQRNNKTAVCQ